MKSNCVTTSRRNHEEHQYSELTTRQTSGAQWLGRALGFIVLDANRPGEGIDSVRTRVKCPSSSSRFSIERVHRDGACSNWGGKLYNCDGDVF